MNPSALIAVVVFAAAFLCIFGWLYWDAFKSNKRGEMASEGLVILRWALLGVLVIYALLGLTAILD
ncbi:MAG: hypothetical protein JRN15_03530 [Nitrososphaerota archaeon]|jgi:DNA-binding transcriptional regulator of glucitol operon|nr:hypothetical protein [Nitrososphaerota archaeon]